MFIRVLWEFSFTFMHLTLLGLQPRKCGADTVCKPTYFSWLREFLCFADRASQYNLSNWPAQCTNSCFIISLLYAFTCFEHCCVHHQEVKVVLPVSGIVTHCRWPSGAQVESGPVHRTATTECDDTRCCIIQFDLLMMSTTVLETCRGI